MLYAFIVWKMEIFGISIDKYRKNLYTIYIAKTFLKF